MATIKKPRKQITVEELKNLYYKYDNEDAASILGISKGTLRNYIKRFGIPMKGSSRKLKWDIVEKQKEQV